MFLKLRSWHWGTRQRSFDPSSDSGWNTTSSSGLAALKCVLIEDGDIGNTSSETALPVVEVAYYNVSCKNSLGSIAVRWCSNADQVEDVVALTGVGLESQDTYEDVVEDDDWDICEVSH